MAGQQERRVSYLMATQSPGVLQKKNTLISLVSIQTYLSVVGGATGGGTTRKTGLISHGNSKPGCSSVEENGSKYTRKSCLYSSASKLMLHVTSML